VRAYVRRQNEEEEEEEEDRFVLLAFKAGQRWKERAARDVGLLFLREARL